MRFLIASLLICFVGCQSSYVDLPPGNTGRILTPKGWDTKVLLPGQVDVGVIDNTGMGNRLVTIAAGSLTCKEQFDLRADGQDHRLTMKNNTPVSCDVYIQVVAPDPVKEKEDYETCFTLVEPKEKDKRLSHIDIEDIYNKFAQPHIRGGIRGLSMGYADFDKFTEANIISGDSQEGEFSKKIASLVLKVFKDNKVPLRILGISVSNIKQDDVMKIAAVKDQAVDSDINREVKKIKAISDAIEANPGAMKLLIWDKLGECLEKAGKGGHTFIIQIGDGQDLKTNFAPVEHLRKKLEAEKK